TSEGALSEQQPPLDAVDVLVERRAGDGAAVADVEVAPGAQLQARAELEVDDGVAGAAGDDVVAGVGVDEVLLAVEERPADDLDDGGEAEARVLVGVVRQAEAVADDVAGEAGRAADGDE